MPNPAARQHGAARPEDKEPACGLSAAPPHTGVCTIQSVRACHAGEWVDSAALRAEALEHLSDPAHNASDLVVDLEGVDHLEAGALQVLVALSVEQHRRGVRLFCHGASSELQHWFGLAGAADLVQPTSRESLKQE